jgi:hypothetical protein
MLLNLQTSYEVTSPGLSVSPPPPFLLIPTTYIVHESLKYQAFSASRTFKMLFPAWDFLTLIFTCKFLFRYNFLQEASFELYLHVQ